MLNTKYYMGNTRKKATLIIAVSLMALTTVFSLFITFSPLNNKDIFGYYNTDFYTIPTAKTDLVYNGNAQKLINAGRAYNTSDYDMVYKLGSEGTWSTSLPSATNAGKYTVYYGLRGAYNEISKESSLTVTIARAASSVKTAPTAESLTYSGSAQALVNAGTASGGTMQYSFNQFTDYTNSIPSATNAGTYKVWYRVLGDNNHNISMGFDYYVSVTIEKADITKWNLPTARYLTYNGGSQALVNAGTATGGSFEYDYHIQDYTHGNENGWRYLSGGSSILSASNVGTYLIHWYIKGDDNHNNYYFWDDKKQHTWGPNSSVQSYIYAKKNEVNAPTGQTNLVYNGQNQSLIKYGATLKTGSSGTIQYKVGENGNWGTGTPMAGAAGSYTIYYKATAGGYTAQGCGCYVYNYAESNVGNIVVTIAKKTCSVANVPTGKTGLTYTGLSQSLINTGGAANDGGKMQYKLSSDNTWHDKIADVKATNPGKYTVQYKVAATNGNYSDSATFELEVSIGNGTASCTAVPTVKSNLVYTENQQQLLATAGTAANGTLYYRLKGTVNWTNSWTSIKGTNATTYTIEYYVKGNTNYNDSETKELTVAIANATASINTHPTGKSGLIYNTQAQQLLATAGGCKGGTLQYKLSTESEWKATITEVTGTNAGTYTIDYYVKGGTYYDDSITNHLSVVIAKASANVSKAPTGKTGLLYNGSAQSLLATAGTPVGGTIKFKLSTAATWDASYTNIKATDPATYTIQYYVEADNSGNYYSTSTTSPGTLVVKISAGNQTITKGTLAGRSLTYTGSNQQLYTGAATHTAPGNKKGTMYYGFSTASTTKPTSDNTNLASLVATDGWNSSGQITYYLWYRVTANGIYTNAIDWTYTNVTVKIAKATYSVAVTINSNVVYDGQNHQIYSTNPVVTSDSGAPNSLLTVKYKLVYTGHNGYVQNYAETTTPNVTLQSVMNAGTYVLSATWAAASTTNYNINTGAKTFSTYTINKSDSFNKVEVSGLTYTNANELDASASCYPFRSKTAALELKAFGQTVHNGITASGNNYNGYNQLKIALVKGIEYAQTAPADSEFTGYATAATLNSAITNLVVHTSGSWYLWLKVTKHNSLIDGANILAASFTISAFNDALVNLTGLTMTGANGVIGADGAIIYNAKANPMVASGTGVKAAQAALKLGTVSYAVSTSSNNSVRPTLQWKDNPYDDEQFKVKNVGTYFLWVSWTETTTVKANSGVIYARLEIKPLSGSNMNFYFSGVDLATAWGTADTSTSSLSVYHQTFNNNDKAISSSAMSSIRAYDSNGNEVTADLSGTGALSVGVSTSSTTMNGDYYETLSALKVKSAGSYYLWVRWPGSANVDAGEAVYKVQADRRMVQFNVAQLTNDTPVELANPTAVQLLGGKTQQEYKYEFMSEGSSGTFAGLAQPLFTTSSPLNINIDGKLYNESSVTFKYKLSTESANMPTTGSDWANTIDQAVQTDVNQYYIWVLVSIDDGNAKLSKTFQCGTASIIKTSSYVRIAPKPILNLEFNSQPQTLITASGQLQPPVQYALGIKNGDNYTYGTWTTNVNDPALKPTAAGIYRVYYCGAAYSTMFATESEPYGGYPYIEVSISESSTEIAIKPKAIANVVYTGKEVVLFEPGFAEGGGLSNIPLVYSWDGKDYYYYDDLPKKIDAGTYTLSFKPDPSNENFKDTDSTTITMTLTIAKADISVSIGFIMSDEALTFAAVDYHLFLTPVDYTMIDQDGYRLTNANGLTLSYSNRENPQFNGGNMGTISYAVTNSPAVYPNNSEWKTNIEDVTARQVGIYYLWVKVESGDNHLFSPATCYNPGNPIRIIPAQEEDIRLTESSYRAYPNFRYNGLSRTLLEKLDLKIKVKNRNDNGEIIDGYNQIQVTDYIGKIYYALGDSPKAFPSEQDIDNTETSWQSSWQILSRKNAGTYHLLIMIVFDTNSNIAPLMVCLSNLEGVEGNEIKINKAVYDDINLSGISGISKMYTGQPQAIAVGNLNVSIASSRYSVTQDEIFDAKYIFMKKDWSAPNVDAEWTDWDHAKVTDVSQYQLYVYLQLSNNFDNSEPFIYPLFLTDNNYAEIVKTNKKNLEIIAPKFAENLVYNGQEQNLILGAARLVMKDDGAEINGQKGEVYYYISSSMFEYNNANQTLHGGEKYADYVRYIKEKHVGTYYIWAEFAEGDSYEAIDPVYVGSVTIKQATEENFTLSGLEHTTNTYDGKKHMLTNGAVVQTFIDGGAVLNNADDYETIKYAYSNDPNIAPLESLWTTDYRDLLATDANKYYIWISVTGKNNTVNGNKNVADYVKCYFNSNDDYAEIVRAALIKSDIDGVVEHTGLVYIGQNQVLASIEDKLSIVLTDGGENLNQEKYNHLTFYWGLGSGNGGDHGTNTQDAPEDAKWFSRIEDVCAMDYGDYYLWLWMPESKNFAEYKVCFATISIGKAVIKFTQAPGIFEGENALVYNGSYQNLLYNDPVIKFYAKGAFYDPAKEYYDAIGVMPEYRISNETGSRWVTDFRDIKGLNAKTYVVNYKVFASLNWDDTDEDIDVSIEAVDASTELIGLAEAPKAKENLSYNEKEQTLIDYGRLSDNLMEAGCGAALEGCRIIFYYAERPSATYEYYYNEDLGEYVWDSNKGELPGRTNWQAEDYHIQYYVTASTKTGNYKQSRVKDLYIKMHKREIWWNIAPEPIHGIKYVGESQTALTPGILNVGATSPSEAKGVTVKYSLDEPGTIRGWQDTIPQIDQPGFWYIWYYVEVDDNNIFVGPNNNDPMEGSMLVVLVERYILTIRNLPEKSNLMYTGVEQNLVSSAALSTDEIDSFGDNAPYFEYSLNPNGPFERTVTAKPRGTYNVYYRLHYNDSIFDFRGENDGRETPLKLIVTINAMNIATDSIRAVYVPDDDGGTVTYDATSKILNEETGELEKVPSYSEAFIKEFEPHIKYFYRLYDKFNTDESWLPWVNGVTYLNELGTYQFMLTIESTDETDEFNFDNYQQSGIIPFDTYVIVEDRTLEVVMQDYSALAYVRAWIDMTGTMTYDEADYKYETWIANNGKFEIRFYDVNSTGRNGNAVIRLQTINSSYYYISSVKLSTEEKLKTNVQTSDVKNAIRAFNKGLIYSDITVYLYEVYRIQYDANSGTGGTTPPEGWKWHKINYKLEENNFIKMTENGKLEPNGWNTSRAGNGNNYGSGSMYYIEDASQIFYANFFTGDNYYTIEWIITDGITTYALSRDSEEWFDMQQEPSRARGMKIAQGEYIILPQVEITGDMQSLSVIFGGYVLGWRAVADDWQPSGNNSNRLFTYTAGMKAERNIRFVADLNFNLDDYVECDFLDDEGELVHESGRVANNAQAYMALSGMDANTIKNYSDGYVDWIEKHGTETLKRENADANFNVSFDIGAKMVFPETEEPVIARQTSIGEYIGMTVILVLGVAATAGSITFYILMRKKRTKLI